MCVPPDVQPCSWLPTEGRAGPRSTRASLGKASPFGRDESSLRFACVFRHDDLSHRFHRQPHPSLSYHNHHVSRRRHHPLRDWLRSGHSRARPRLRIRTVRHHVSQRPAAPRPYTPSNASKRPIEPTSSPCTLRTDESERMPPARSALPSFESRPHAASHRPRSKIRALTIP